MRQIWKNYADKYRDLGLQVVPIKPGTKVCYEKGWQEADPQRFSEARFDDHGIGLLTGSVSGIVAVDIDNDDILQDVLKILPPTPCWKVGSKGATYFYKFQDQVSNPKIYLNGVPAIEILQDGQQTVLPPTLHPNGKEYSWGDPTNDLLNAVQDLPSLGLQVVEQLRNLVNKKQNILTQKSFTGRDNHLTEMAWAAVCKNKSRDLIIIELLEIDQKMHNPPFATDATEIKTRNKTPAEVMAAFVDQAIKKRGKEYQPCVESKQMGNPPLYSFERKERQLPQLPGFLSELACYLGHGTKCYNGSVIFALFVMSQLFGKRIEFYNSEDELRTAINLYFLYVCPSGIGKGRLKTRMLNFLRAFQNKQENARRVQAPKSEAAIYKMFKKPVVAIIQEEFHKLLAFSKNNNSPLSGINETLGDIFGEGAGELLPKDAADDSNASELILEPFLSILGMTQPRSFKNKVLGKDDPDEIFHQGLGARLIYAVDANKKLPRIDKNKTALNISYFEKEIGEILKLVRKDQLTGNVPQIELGIGVLPLVQALAEEYDAEADAEDERSSGESLLLPVINRRLECSLKIGVIYALCEIRNRNKLIFECSDLLGAIELVRYFESQLDELIFREKVSDDAKRVLDRIINAKENGITEREIIRKNHQAKEIVRQQIIALLGQKLIVAAERKEKTGPATIVYMSSKFINPN